MKLMHLLIFPRRLCLLLLLFMFKKEINAKLCISETYAGQCKDTDPECGEACRRDDLNGGKCGLLKSIRVCYCDRCPEATGLERNNDKTLGQTTSNPRLEEVNRNSQYQQFPIFSFKSLLSSECIAMATTNCKIRGDEVYSNDCSPKKSLNGFCTSKAEEFEAGYFLQKIGQSNAGRGLQLSLGGKRTFTKQIFQPIADILIVMVVFDFPMLPVSVFASASIKLPVLMSLQIFNCQSITIQRGDFLPFPSLRQVLFTAKTTIASIEENAFESITHLQHITFEQGFDTSNGLPAELKTQLSLIHCGREYKWLRDWLLLRPFLITPKKFGEVYTVADMSNSVKSKKDIFIPVDCASISLISNKSDGLFSSLMDG